MTAVLGIDPSSAACGWSLLDVQPAGASLRQGGVIRRAGSWARAPQRDWLRELMARVAALPEADVYAIEDYACTHVRTVVGWTACFLGIRDTRRPVLRIAPTRVKRLVAGSGRATKEQVAEAVARVLGHPYDTLRRDLPAPVRLDFSDACAVALAAAQEVPL